MLKLSAVKVKQLLMTDKTDMRGDELCAALDAGGPNQTQGDLGRCGGMLSGRLGPNKLVAVTPLPKKSHYRARFIEGAIQKANGKWSNSEMFPGREFDDLDEYRAAKKQRKERRAAYADNYL